MTLAQDPLPNDVAALQAIIARQAEELDEAPDEEGHVGRPRDIDEQAVSIPLRHVERLVDYGRHNFLVPVPQVDSLEEFDLLSKRDFLMFIEPPSIDDRIVNQFALFSMISNPRM